MKTGAVVFFLLLLIGQTAVAQSLVTLDQLQWKNRVLLLDSDAAHNGGMEALLKADAEVVDRDIVWFVLSLPGLISNYGHEVHPALAQALRTRYFEAWEASVVLIGKDGTVKDRSRYLDLPRLFTLIDSMPMRQQEMGR